ncbi:hypothetical protein NYA28ABAC_03071 [Salinicola sp. NYA28a]|jgi:hypothetical protein
MAVARHGSLNNKKRDPGSDGVAVARLALTGEIPV